MDQLGTWSDMSSAVILPNLVHKIFEIYFCVLLRVYRLVFINVLMYNPLWEIVMGPYAARKRGVNCFIKKFVQRI
jgi:hypothetical protein